MPNIGQPPVYAFTIRNDWKELDSKLMGPDAHMKALRAREKARLAATPDWFKAIINRNYDD